MCLKSMKIQRLSRSRPKTTMEQQRIQILWSTRILTQTSWWLLLTFQPINPVYRSSKNKPKWNLNITQLTKKKNQARPPPPWLVPVGHLYLRRPPPTARPYHSQILIAHWRGHRQSSRHSAKWAKKPIKPRQREEKWTSQRVSKLKQWLETLTYHVKVSIVAFL